MKMNRRLARLALPIVAAVGILAGTVGTAHANSGSGATGPVSQGGCNAQFWYDSNGWFTQNVYVPWPACDSYYQFKIACGVYGVPGTYYWYAMRYEHFAHSYAYNWLNTPTTNSCPYWGNDIVLDIALVDGAAGACWRLNRGYWYYGDSNCNIQTDFSIQWGVS